MGQKMPLQQTNNAIDQLTPKQKMFVHHYIQNGFNGSKAYHAIHPGCKQSTAEVNASRMLGDKKIKDALREMCNQALNGDIDVLRYKIIKALESIAFSDIGDLMKWDNKGVTLYPSEGLDTRPVKSIQMTKKVLETKNGDTIITVNSKLILHDCLRALNTLARILGMFHHEKNKPVNIIQVCKPATSSQESLPGPEVSN